MLLTRDPDGVVLLAGEPLEQWAKVRGIEPIRGQFFRRRERPCMCVGCLGRDAYDQMIAGRTGDAADAD